MRLIILLSLLSLLSTTSAQADPAPTPRVQITMYSPDNIHCIRTVGVPVSNHCILTVAHGLYPTSKGGTVSSQDGNVRQANPAFANSSTDICVLMTVSSSPALQCIPLALQTNAPAGSRVYVCTLRDGKEVSIAGNITLLSCPVMVLNLNNQPFRMDGLTEVHFDQPVGAGDSGSPIVDQAGRLLGLFANYQFKKVSDTRSKDGYYIPFDQYLSALRGARLP